MVTQLLLGTYTRHNSQGIYRVTLDEATASLDNLTLVADIGSPTYLTTAYSGDVLFSIINTEEQGGVASFTKDDNGEYTLADKVLKDGSAPCYVAFDSDRNLLYDANYHTGQLNIYRTDTDGSLTLLNSIQHTGHSIHPNQTSPHAHYFDLDPTKTFTLACDLGTDEVITYQISDNGHAEIVSKLTMAPGTGPRHLVFHPNTNYLYILGELSNEIVVGSYNPKTGDINLIQTISTLPEDFTESSSGAAIRISHDGKFLYASNRGHNSIVVYRIKEDNTLEAIQWINTEGEHPRDFNLTPDNRFIICGHQHTDTLSLFKRDNSTGRLTLISDDMFAPEVVCINPV